MSEDVFCALVVGWLAGFLPMAVREWWREFVRQNDEWNLAPLDEMALSPEEETW